MLLDATGSIRLAPTFETDLDVDLRRIDLQRLVKSAPRSQLDADIRVRVSLDEEGRPRARLSGDTSPTILEGTLIPGMDVDVLVDAKGASGSAHIHEMGMPVRADFFFSPTHGLRLSAAANVPSLQAVPRFKRAVQGYAVAKVEGTYHQGIVDAKVAVSGGNLSREGVRIGSASVELDLVGPPDHLRMNASMSGRGAQFGALHWDAFHSVVQGPMASPHVRVHLQDRMLPNVTATASVDMRGQLAAKNVDIKLEQGREIIEVKTPAIEIRSNIIDLGEFSIEGLGSTLEGVAALGPKGFDVQASSDSIDMDRALSFFPLLGPRITGVVGVDIDLRGVGSESYGCIRLDVADAEVKTLVPIPRVDGSIRAQFTGRLVDVYADMALGATGDSYEAGLDDPGVCIPTQPRGRDGLVTARATGSLTLTGAPMDVSSWKEATGTGRLEQLAIDLDRVSEMYGGVLSLVNDEVGGSIPIVKGKVSLQADVVLERADQLPSWSLTASSRGLQVSMPESTDRVAGDIVASASMSSAGMLLGSVCLRKGAASSLGESCNPNDRDLLASVGWLAALDYRRLVDDPESWKQVLLEAQVQGNAVVHDRSLVDLFSPWKRESRWPLEAGYASANIGFRGTALEPHIDYRMNVTRVASSDPGWRAPVSVCVRGQYDGDKAWAHVDLRRSADNQSANAVCALSPTIPVHGLGSVDATVQVAWKDVLAWSSLPRIPWVANMDAAIAGFDLADIPVLADQGYSGQVRMTAAIRGIGAKPTFDVQVGLEALRMGSTVSYDQSHLWLQAGDSGFHGALAFIDVDDNGEPTSSLRVSMDTDQVQWMNGWMLTRYGGKPVRIAVDANRFKLGMLSPLAQPVFSYVDGELTGKAQATWSPTEGKSRVESLSFYVDNGAFQVPIIGQEFLQVKGLLQAADSERIFIEHVQAQSLTGGIEARATVDLDEFDFRHIDASIWTKQGEKIRLTFAGMPVGDMYGTINVAIDPKNEKRNTKENKVVIEFDRVTVDLPRTDLRSVQQLEDNADIKIVPTLDPSWRAMTNRSAVTPWIVSLQTKNPIILQRFDMTFSVVLAKDGRDRLVLSYPDKETGEVSLQGHAILYDGRIDVVGNRFDLEENNAWVIFTGDPAHPQLNVTARWDAPDGTRVFADVTGPLRDPRIQFRSEPAMTQAEILGLLLFGPSSQGGATMAAGTTEGEGNQSSDMSSGVSSGVAAAGINMLLQDLSPVVSTRFDTSRGQSPSPTLIVQVSRDVTAEATYVAEEATLDKADRYLVSFDWRFLRQWSLRITRGNVGTSVVDVLWQHRY